MIIDVERGPRSEAGRYRETREDKLSRENWPYAKLPYAGPRVG